MSSGNKFSCRRGGRHAQERVLQATLLHVGKRRQRRRQVGGISVALALGVAAIGTQWKPFDDAVENSGFSSVASNNATTISIQRIRGTRESRIERSSYLGNPEKLAITSRSPQRISRISEGELLVSLPEGLVAGLVRSPDGTSHLVVLGNAEQ